MCQQHRDGPAGEVIVGQCPTRVGVPLLLQLDEPGSPPVKNDPQGVRGCPHLFQLPTEMGRLRDGLDRRWRRLPQPHRLGLGTKPMQARENQVAAIQSRVPGQRNGSVASVRHASWRCRVERTPDPMRLARRRSTRPRTGRSRTPVPPSATPRVSGSAVSWFVGADNESS